MGGEDEDEDEDEVVVVVVEKEEEEEGGVWGGTGLAQVRGLSYHSPFFSSHRLISLSDPFLPSYSKKYRRRRRRRRHRMDSSASSPPARILPTAIKKLSARAANARLESFLADFEQRSSPLNGGDHTATVQLQKLTLALARQRQVKRGAP